MTFGKFMGEGAAGWPKSPVTDQPDWMVSLHEHLPSTAGAAPAKSLLIRGTDKLISKLK